MGSFAHNSHFSTLVPQLIKCLGCMWLNVQTVWVQQDDDGVSSVRPISHRARTWGGVLVIVISRGRPVDPWINKWSEGSLGASTATHPILQATETQLSHMRFDSLCVSFENWMKQVTVKIKERHQHRLFACLLSLLIGPKLHLQCLLYLVSYMYHELRNREEDTFWIRGWKTERGGGRKSGGQTSRAGREEIQFVPSVGKTQEPKWSWSK